MSLLDDLTSKDPSRIWSASGAIRTLRDSALLTELAIHLEQIRTSTQGIDLGGVLRANSTHLNFALRKLEWVQNSEGCLCGLYPLDDMYNPNSEAGAGNITILSTQYMEGGHIDFYNAECNVCGTVFRIWEQDYHYPWWSWRYSIVQEVYFGFRIPVAGWFPVDLKLDNFHISEEASDAINDPISELINLLDCCKKPGSWDSLVYFWLEPGGYIIEVSKKAETEFIQVQISTGEIIGNLPSSRKILIFVGELPVAKLKHALIEGFEMLFRCSVDSVTAWTQEPDWASYRLRFEELVAA
ncbi:MAG: hypothetical protein QM758_00335 [Armatimonas sp.]